MKTKDLTILLVLIGLLALLQMGGAVMDDLRWNIPGVSSNDYAIENRCYDEIVFETVVGEEWLRVSHDLSRKFDPPADFQLRRDDGERMTVQVNDLTMTGNTVAVQLEQYDGAVQLITCADE